MAKIFIKDYKYLYSIFYTFYPVIFILYQKWKALNKQMTPKVCFPSRTHSSKPVYFVSKETKPSNTASTNRAKPSIHSSVEKRDVHAVKITSSVLKQTSSTLLIKSNLKSSIQKKLQKIFPKNSTYLSTSSVNSEITSPPNSWEWALILRCVDFTKSKRNFF